MQLINFRMWQIRAGVKDIDNKDYKFFSESNLMQKKYFYDVKISKVNC